ncbi:DUF4129 domain-containing protein [Spirosoma foliorum]|uniref:DUF4129 domain-containing protein n=1 Tax=Spirosoma foliorum TaxID=2710596 RepID=A0A7G5GSN1_9BACT|nr:DUF4129 domain-containing protein [Spirosoma foliorum]QMW01873.1 DUF4129 domain-containing protein [Spirosoma foliorum]
MKDRIELRVAVYELRVGRLCCLILWLCLLLAIPPAALAQVQKTTPPVAVRDDRTPLQVRYPEADHLRDLQTDHDYQYGNDAPPPENPIARFFQWLFRKIGAFLRSESYYNVWQYVILAGVVALVIYLLMKAEVMKILFPKSAQSSGLDYENLAENIHEIDFDVAVEEAVNNRNFRLATRLLYLQTLKRLTDAGRITYKPDKTNRQYVYELANSPLQADFETLTRQFEFVWYGDFPIDESRFGQLRQQFRQFNQPVAHQA